MFYYVRLVYGLNALKLNNIFKWHKTNAELDKSPLLKSPSKSNVITEQKKREKKKNNKIYLISCIKWLFFGYFFVLFFVRPPWFFVRQFQCVVCWVPFALAFSFFPSRLISIARYSLYRTIHNVQYFIYLWNCPEFIKRPVF